MRAPLTEGRRFGERRARLPGQHEIRKLTKGPQVSPACMTMQLLGFGKGQNAILAGCILRGL